jgi:hypothetical protein
LWLLVVVEEVQDILPMDQEEVVELVDLELMYQELFTQQQ